MKNSTRHQKHGVWEVAKARGHLWLQSPDPNWDRTIVQGFRVISLFEASEQDGIINFQGSPRPSAVMASPSSLILHFFSSLPNC